MAVIRCKLIKDRGGESNARYERTYEQKWRVETNDPLDGPQIVRDHHELPEVGDSYASGNDADDTAFLANKSVEEEGEGHVSWIVTCSYSNFPPQEFNANPLLEQPRYSLSFDSYNTVARQSLQTGARILNSVDQPFTPNPEVDQPRPIYVVRRNESSINLANVLQCNNTVNQAAWKGCAPRTVKCKSILTGEIQERSGLKFYEMTYEFHLNPLTWDLRILNQATRYWTSPLAANKTIDLPPGSEPVTLYVKNNAIVAKGDTVSDDAVFYEDRAGAPSNVVYLRYRYYKEINFNAVFPF